MRVVSFCFSLHVPVVCASFCFTLSVISFCRCLLLLLVFILSFAAVPLSFAHASYTKVISIRFTNITHENIHQKPHIQCTYTYAFYHATVYELHLLSQDDLLRLFRHSIFYCFLCSAATDDMSF